MMDLKTIAVIGAGTMGRGIAQWFSEHFVHVELVDTTEELSMKAVSTIHQNWDKLQEKEKFTGCQVGQFKNHLHPRTLETITKDVDLVIEAIFENLELKIDLFTKLDKYCDEKTILASNTSSFPMEKMSAHLKPSRQKNFIGLHFFNPAPLMKLVEIIESHWTDKNLARDLYQWFESKGKMPALSKDAPGFIVNRVARNFYGEAFRILESLDPDKIKEIDSTLREVGGFKMGPFELMDLIGIDVNLNVTESVWHAFNEHPRFSPHSIQKEMVKKNHLGRKTKKGFYDYP